MADLSVIGGSVPAASQAKGAYQNRAAVSALQGGKREAGDSTDSPKINNSIQHTPEALQEMRAFNEFQALNAEGKPLSQVMGKDQFLKILITQLQHQDPTKPVEDKEFISQMAQFSSLEQMQNMGDGLTKMGSSFTTLSESLTQSLGATQAISLLGREVDVAYLVDKEGANGEIIPTKEEITGQVTAVKGGSDPQIVVNNAYYSVGSISKVYH